MLTDKQIHEFIDKVFDEDAEAAGAMYEYFEKSDKSYIGGYVDGMRDGIALAQKGIDSGGIASPADGVK